jgi:hypothetical protein
VPTLDHSDRWRELSRKECILFLSALCASLPLFTLASDFIFYKQMHTGRPLPSLEEVMTSILTAVILWIWGYIDWERSKAKSVH